MKKSNCPLCSSVSAFFQSDSDRSYQKCMNCELVYVPRDELLTPQEEFKRYGLHENNENDSRYRDYLGKIVEAVINKLTHQKQGLDFGCGASLLMENLFRERHFEVDSYDVYFHPREDILNKKFDFIVLSEVIEHLRSPREEMLKLRSLLRPGGAMFIKTRYLPHESSEFLNWYYKKDPTHIQFFNHSSMSYLAHLLKLHSPEGTELLDMIYMID